jgi:uncharacterized repeat protein (TIGR02543 family)
MFLNPCRPGLPGRVSRVPARAFLACALAMLGAQAWAQSSTVTVRAWGSLASNAGPQMQLRVNGVVVGSTEVRATSYQNYSFPGVTVPAGARLELVFDNDAYAPGGADRNLFVESVTANGVTMASTAPGVVFDRGQGAAAFDGVDVLPGRSDLWWNGALRFTVAAAPAPAKYTLYAAIGAGGGGTVTSPNGINCPGDCNDTWPQGTVFKLLATPAAGYVFSSWSGGCTGTEAACSVILNGTTHVTANFKQGQVVTPVLLSTTVSGSGSIRSAGAGINCGTDCSKSVVPGTKVDLTATPASGHRFVNWSGACTGTAPSCSLTLSANATATAHFAAVTATSFNLTVARTGSGSVTAPGIACGADCSEAYAAGQVVTLAAAPASGYTFAGWGGACSGTGGCLVTMSANASVTANFSPSGTTGGKYIPLNLAGGPVADKVPLRTGIPFPKGALSDLARLRLETADGTQEVPAQFDAISRWPDGSIKVALTHVVSDLGAARSYRVAYGPGVVRSALPRNVAVSGTPSTEITVDTGLVRFAVNPKGIVTRLWRDANANGVMEPGEQVIDAGDLFVVNAFDNREYTASAAQDAVVTVEENGPMRAVIKAQGSLTSSSDTKLIKYLVRYYASQGSDKVDMDVSIIDDRMEANVQWNLFQANERPSFAFAAKAMGMRWRYLSEGAADYRFGGQGGVAYGGKVTGEHYLLQKGDFKFETITENGERHGYDRGHSFSYSGVGAGEKAPGWVALDSGNRHVALMVKDFWQQFPGELSVNGNTLTASLFPERAGGTETSRPAVAGDLYRRAGSMYFAREGGAKTYQLRLAFGAGLPATTALHAMNDSFQRHQLELTATPAWYTASGVFGDLTVGNAAAATGHSAMLMNDIYVPSIEATDGNATMFGWRDYGDRLRAGWAYKIGSDQTCVPSFYNDTHIGANKFFTEFVRTGDQRWFQLGDISTRHFMDIDVSHGPRAGYWPTGGVAQPAGEVHAINHENVDHQVRNLHWGHAHVSGLSNLYLLTGDKRSLEVLTEIANWWKFVTPHFFATPFNQAAKYREAERDYGWPLYVMNEYVRVTGDAAYHKAVNGQLVNYLIQWWQTPLNHIGYNPSTNTVSNSVINVSDASRGTGYWTMTRMDNSSGTQATGTNPWMAGPLLSNVIQFYENDKLMAAAGKGAGISNAVIEDMLFQTMNYVVKYGYVNPTIGFAYSETTRTYSGGHTLLDFPLAYLDRLYQQRMAASAIPHPQWYDTQPQWGVIARKHFDEMNAAKVGANRQSYGFYGYEMVYPMDFFKVMGAP